MRCYLIFALGLALALFCHASAHCAGSRTFQAEGTDTGMGIGPRYMALGGAGAAASNDVYAAYYNPAGLAEIKGPEVSVSRQLNAKLHDINFFGVALPLPLPGSLGLDVTVAGVYYPRIHARASGAFNKTDFESNYLRFLMPGIAGTFDGDIDSKTKTYRLAMGISAASSGPWSFGLYLDVIDCKSTFCGVHARSNGYTSTTVSAVAYGTGLGARYRLNSEWTLAATVSDLNTRLKVKRITTDNAGTVVDNFIASFPRKISIGVACNVASGALISADYDITKGKYGSSEIDLQFLRAGFEKAVEAWSYRAGLLAPLRVRSSVVDGNRVSVYMSPTIGLGWRKGGIQVDFVLYAHPAMSISKGKVSPDADLALIWRY